MGEKLFICDVVIKPVSEGGQNLTAVEGMH